MRPGGDAQLATGTVEVVARALVVVEQTAVVDAIRLVALDGDGTTQQANLDIRQWGLALGQLPRARGTVTRNGLIFSLAITWQDLDTNTEAPANQTAALNVLINDP